MHTQVFIRCDVAAHQPTWHKHTAEASSAKTGRGSPHRNAPPELSALTHLSAEMTVLYAVYKIQEILVMALIVMLSTFYQKEDEAGEKLNYKH